MSNLSRIAITSIAIAALSTGAIAQNIYKCGDAYSQLPCPNGVLVNAADQRTNEQKSQADLATDRDARTAKAMESARLQQEAIDLAANTPPPKPAGADPASKRQASPAKKTVTPKKKPAYARGKVRTENNGKQASKNTAAKKEPGKS